MPKLRDHLAVRQADLLAKQRPQGLMFTRVNRVLKKSGLELVRSKVSARKYLGSYYILCLQERAVVRTHLDLHILAYELGLGGDPRVPFCSTVEVS